MKTRSCGVMLHVDTKRFICCGGYCLRAVEDRGQMGDVVVEDAHP
jgi:hypothetical protein